MHSYTQFFLDMRPALATTLARVPGVNGHQLATSVFDFVGQQGQQLRPPGIVNGLRQRGAGQGHDVQVFNANQCVSGGQSPREFMREVAPLIGYLAMQARYQRGLFVPVTGELHPAGQDSLRVRQLRFGNVKVAWVLDHCAVRQRHHRIQANIQTNRRTGVWRGRGIGQFKRDDRVPVRPVTFEVSALDRRVFGQWAVPLHLDRADILDVQAVGLETDPVTPTVLNGVEAPLALEAGIAWLITCPDATEEGGKGLVQAAESLLDAGVVKPGRVLVKLPDRLQLIGLSAVVERDAAHAPGVAAFLKRGVVKLAVNLQHAVQELGLPPIRVEAVGIIAVHGLLVPALDLAVTLEGFFGNMDAVAAAPQCRKPAAEVSVLRLQHRWRGALELVGEALSCVGRISRQKQVEVIGHDLQRVDSDFRVSCHAPRIAQMFYACQPSITRKAGRLLGRPGRGRSAQFRLSP